MTDETKDRKKNRSITLCYVENGVSTKSLSTIEEAFNLTAVDLTDLILNVLTENNINNEKMLSQSYDGAVVIEGHKGGLHVLIQQKWKL